jgi:hypothetical protein
VANGTFRLVDTPCSKRYAYACEVRPFILPRNSSHGEHIKAIMANPVPELKVGCPETPCVKNVSVS